MTQNIGSSELKNQTSRLRRKKVKNALAELDALAHETSAGWTSEKTAVEMLEEMREKRCQSLTQT